MTDSNYTLYNAGRVMAGAGSSDQLGALAAEMGARRALIVSDRGVARAGLVEGPKRALANAGIAVAVIDDVPPEPEAAHVEATLAAARAAGDVDFVVGIGGGSAMDVAKLIAVLLAQPVTLAALLGKAPIPGRGLPMAMIPTTAGTGSEATPNSIVLVPEDESKVGVVSARLVPDAVILDPLLTVSLPAHVTASTGMDALTHAIECYCSKKGNPFSDLYGLEGIRLIARSLRRAYSHPDDIAARHDMLLGAYYGGVSIATSCTTAVHALAYPLQGKYRIAHGLSNAMLLPFVMEFNLQGSEARFHAMARAMGLPVEGGSPGAAGEAMIVELYRLNADLGIVSSLRDKGIGDADIDGLIDGASKVTRLLDNNPRPMTRDDMRAIYRRLM